jgi:hypothetical protein
VVLTLLKEYSDIPEKAEALVVATKETGL